MTCTHLDKVVDAVSNYNIILAYYATCIAEGAYKRKAADAYCRLCKSIRRIHACLECAFFGCFDQKNGGKSHMEGHYLKNNHCIAININHGCLFCFECNDYIYNETFEDIFKEYKLEAIKINGNQSCMPWKPKAEEIAKLKGKIKKISDDSYIGLRGIISIGQLCYMNVIIHSFIHNPILRDYFLSDKHRCVSKEPCLTCEMFVLFQEFYSGKKEPYVLSSEFILAMQKCRPAETAAKDFGIVPKDSYEFLGDILKGLHASSCEDGKETDNCNCFIHQTFYGIIQYFRECIKCKISSFLPLDHFIDILLDIDGEDDCLLEVLKRKFLEPQLIDGHKCLRCEQVDTTHLHQTIKKLPPVICFRLNTFEEKQNKTKKKKTEETEYCKKSTKFEFQEWIDMSPYLNSNVDSKLLNGNHEYEIDSYPIENRYQLFAVIIHKGKKHDDGHYSIYVRQQRNKWYECNEVCVSKSSFAEVLECDPFLLFYYKQL